MKLKLSFILIIVAAKLILLSPCAYAKDSLRVATTTPDLADMVSQVGGKRVEAKSLTSGKEDFHLVRPRPRLLVSLTKADVLVKMGLDLEHAWLPSLIKTSKNRKIAPGSRASISVFAGIKVLEKPSNVNRKEGPDLHPKGNPHFNLSPIQAVQMVRNIAKGLSAHSPQWSDEFDSNADAYIKKLEAKIVDWKKRLKAYEGAALIEYHSSWGYLAQDFGFKIVAKLEPKPGVSPSARYLQQVIRTAKSKKVRVILARNRDKDIAEKVAREASAKVLSLPLFSKRKQGYIPFMESIVSELEQAFSG